MSLASIRTQEFISSKTARPIAYRHLAMRIALVQATLDPAVRAINPIGSAAGQALAGTVIALRTDGSFALDVVPARIRGHDERAYRAALGRLRIAPLPITEDDLREEPRRSNCGLIWMHRGVTVPLTLRMGILQALADDGPLPLGELCGRVRADRDPLACVMALACADLIELDLTSGPIGPATIVRVRA